MGCGLYFLQTCLGRHLFQRTNLGHDSSISEMFGHSFLRHGHWSGHIPYWTLITFSWLFRSCLLNLLGIDHCLIWTYKVVFLVTVTSVQMAILGVAPVEYLSWGLIPYYSQRCSLLFTLIKILAFPCSAPKHPKDICLMFSKKQISLATILKSHFTVRWCYCEI